MASFSKMLGRHRDFPLATIRGVGAVAAGSATDFEYAQFTVPDLTKLPLPSGGGGLLPINSVTLQAVYLMPSATITGVVAHNFTLNILQRKNLGVNTTSATAVTSGSTVITPASMNNIQVNTRLLVDTVASGVQETVTVTAVTGTTFTASFANAHSGTWVVVSQPSTPYMALAVNTTSASTVTSGAFTFTPVSMSNIAVGTSLLFSGGTGAAENVVVTATTATTATATFANGHSSSYTITSSPLASIAFTATTVIAQALVPTLLSVLPNNVILAGDIVTVQRVSNDSTGLANPIMDLEYVWLPAKSN